MFSYEIHFNYLQSERRISFQSTLERSRDGRTETTG